jgi:hypothetical protein
MMKYLFGLIGLALLGASPVLGQTPACGCAAPGGCAACGAQAGCDGACKGCSQCDEDCKCCPHCGCKLVPVCHPYCETKTTTKHDYCCHCKDHCVPGPEHCRKDCDGCCQEECNHCCIREIHKLAIIPVCEEEQVRKCKVEWVCPRCTAHASASAPVIVTPAPAGPAPVIPANPPGIHMAPPYIPGPTKTTDSAPMPGDLSTVESP